MMQQAAGVTAGSQKAVLGHEHKLLVMLMEEHASHEQVTMPFLNRPSCQQRARHIFQQNFAISHASRVDRHHSTSRMHSRLEETLAEGDIGKAAPVAFLHSGTCTCTGSSPGHASYTQMLMSTVVTSRSCCQ